MQHSTATIEVAAAVPHEVRANIQPLAGCAVAWSKIAAVVGVDIEVCRVVCGLPPLPAPSGKPVLPWESESRQKSLFG